MNRLCLNIISHFGDDLVEMSSGLIKEGLVIQNLRPLSVVELAEFFVHREPKLNHSTHPSVPVVLFNPVGHFERSVFENVQTLGCHFRYFKFLSSKVLICSVRISGLNTRNFLFNLH